MPPIDLRLVHEEIREFFKDNILIYSLTSRAKLDLLVRKYAPIYIPDTKHSSKVARHDLVMNVLNEHLLEFHGISLCISAKKGNYHYWIWELDEHEIAKIHEEDRRIEELDVRRYARKT